jgi:hypothetical protein
VSTTLSEETSVYVQFGNDNAIEGYRDPTSDDPDLVRYRPLEGQRITEITFPEGISLQEAFQDAVAALGYHMAEGSKPAWVESDSDGLQVLLVEHYGLTPSKNTRPKTWGKDTGANLIGVPGEEGGNE